MVYAAGKLLREWDGLHARAGEPDDITLESAGSEPNLTMNPMFLFALPVGRSVAVGIVIAMLVGVYLAFKIGKFILKMLLWLVVLTATGLAVWWFYTSPHGSL